MLPKENNKLIIIEDFLFPPKHPGGRPRIQVDIEKAYELGTLHCTMQECASHFGCSIDALQNNPEFNLAYKKGLDDGRETLRRLQIDKAMGSQAILLTNPETGEVIKDDKGRPIISRPGYAPDTTMQIWLGKQLLGQRDVQLIGGDESRPIKLEFALVKSKEDIPKLKEGENNEGIDEVHAEEDN